MTLSAGSIADLSRENGSRPPRLDLRADRFRRGLQRFDVVVAKGTQQPVRIIALIEPRPHMSSHGERRSPGNSVIVALNEELIGSGRGSKNLDEPPVAASLSNDDVVRVGVVARRRALCVTDVGEPSLSGLDWTRSCQGHGHDQALRESV